MIQKPKRMAIANPAMPRMEMFLIWGGDEMDDHERRKGSEAISGNGF